MIPLLIGAAKINITPQFSVSMAGYGIRTLPSQGVHDELWAQALVFDDGDRKIVITSVDTLDIPENLVNEVRNAVEAEIDLPAQNIFICATHTHSGPNLDSKEEKNAIYRAELSKKLSRVIQTAFQGRQEAKLWRGKSMLQGIARNRRPNGGPMDPEVSVLSIETMSGKLIAAIVNYTCHATVLGADNLLISADYPGYMRQKIEQFVNPDFITLFMNGASGNINPGGYSPETSMIGHYIPNRTFADAESLGTALANEVLKIFDQPKAPELSYVNSASTWVNLAFQKKPDRKQTEADLDLRQRIVTGLKDTGVTPEAHAKEEIDLAYARLLLSLWKILEHEGASTTAEIHAIQIGSTYLLGIPGEPFVEIGLAIKQRAGEPNVFVVGLANGYIGYIPTEEAYQSGGYEPAAAKVAPGSDAIIVNAALALIERLKEVKHEKGNA